MNQNVLRSQRNSQPQAKPTSKPDSHIHRAYHTHELNHGGAAASNSPPPPAWDLGSGSNEEIFVKEAAIEATTMSVAAGRQDLSASNRGIPGLEL
jgi:hypothetical protein